MSFVIVLEEQTCSTSIHYIETYAPDINGRVKIG